ncbi:hypothetical protein [Thermogemmatispora carboxidivorans]|uniref:hypothetical protein n=1 Tax=Thermogemmatispora carboxidivorans TaxID=1382306 RepID=UPI00069A2ECC|nr:hypothetical protein [Thermogemmatispora carboxidivorans]
MLRRTLLLGSPALALALTGTETTAQDADACDDPTVVLALDQDECQARLLMRAATLAERSGRLVEALRLTQAASELARRSASPYAEVPVAYLAVLCGEYARQHHDAPMLETAHSLARKLRGTLLHDGDLAQLRLQLALLTRPSAAAELARLTLDVWWRPELMLNDGTWHWARGGFVVKSLEALILNGYLEQARELADYFARHPQTFTTYEALRWEWAAIRTRLYGSLAERRAFRCQACCRGYVRQAVIAL